MLAEWMLRYTSAKAGFSLQALSLLWDIWYDLTMKKYSVFSFVVAGIFSMMSTLSFGALQVKYAEGTNPEWKEILDRNYLREEIEGWAAEICRLYTGSTEAVDGEVLSLRLYYGDGVASAGGTTINLNMKWVLDWFQSDPTLSDVRGALVHEMGHAVQGCLSRYLTKQAGEDREVQLDKTIRLSDGTLEHLTEGLAEWVRRYRFASPKEVQKREQDFANKGYVFNEYGDAAGLLEYLYRAYGQEKIKDILYYCSTNRGDKVDTMWRALTGKTFADLLAERNEDLKDRLTNPGEQEVSVARWIGPGDGILTDVANWECVNSMGNPVEGGSPTDSSTVVAWGATVPSIPVGTQLSCASFTVKRWITLDRDIDWRGLANVVIDDGATIRTSGHRLMALSVIGKTMRLYGHLAYESLELDGDLILCAGGILEIPSSGNTQIKGRFCLQDDLPSFFKLPGRNLEAGSRYEILTAEGGLPDDLSTLRIAGLSGRQRCVFEKVGNTLYAVVSEADASFCFWTGAAGDGKFFTEGNWLEGKKPEPGATVSIVFSSGADEVVENDIDDLSINYMEFAHGCEVKSVNGNKIVLSEGGVIANLASAVPEFDAPVEFADEIRTIGSVCFAGGVSAPDIHKEHTDILGRYTLTHSGAWTPEGHHTVCAGASLTVDTYCSNHQNSDSGYVSVTAGGVFTSRVAYVAPNARFINVNHGVVAVTDSVTFMDGWMRMAEVDSCTGEFRYNKLITAGGTLDFNARDAKWNDFHSVTSNVNMVIGPGGMEFVNENGENWIGQSRSLALGCTSDWTLGANKVSKRVIGCGVGDPVRICFNTADHYDPSVKHTVTVAGKIKADKPEDKKLSLAAYGGGTVRFECKSDDQFGGGFTLYDGTTLEFATVDACVGSGDIVLSQNSTLALPPAGSGAVAIAGRLSPVDGADNIKVHVRLGAKDAHLSPGEYVLVVANGSIDPSLVECMSLVVPKNMEISYQFGLSDDKTTLSVNVDSARLCLPGGEDLVVPPQGISVSGLSFDGVTPENPVRIAIADGEILDAGSYLVFTVDDFDGEFQEGSFRLVNAIPAWHKVVFRQEQTGAKTSIYADVSKDYALLGWVNEKSDTTGLTGKWSSADVFYDDNGTALLSGENEFDPDFDSEGSVVIVNVKATFFKAESEDDYEWKESGDSAQAAIRLGVDGRFQVWTNADGGKWMSVSVPGVEPADGGEYAFRLYFYQHPRR